MVNINFIENSSFILDEDSVKYIFKIFDMGEIIKKELGLRQNPFSISNKMFKVESIAGCFSFNNIHINIWPKTFKEGFVQTKDKSILNLVCKRAYETCGDNSDRVIYLGKNNPKNELDNEFIYTLAEDYIIELEKALKVLKITSYETKVEERKNIKGKILIQKELTKVIKTPLIWCKFKTITENNIYNELLLWGCKFFFEIITDLKQKNKLERLIQNFPSFNKTFLNTNSVQKLNIPKNYQIYFKCLTISKNLYLKNFSNKKLSENGSEISGFVINMEKVFENIVGTYLETSSRKLGIEHKRQNSKLLAVSETGGTYKVRPDDIIYSKNGIIIIDAKYKIQLIEKTSKPKREDFYQMIATYIAYDAYKAILIFPEMNNSLKCEHEWSINQVINGKAISITIKSYQINMLEERKNLEKRFIEIINSENL